MKSMAMLVIAAAAALATNTSGARSQDACSKEYVACMDHCVTKPAKSVQEPCMNSCQANNNRCSEKVYGGRREMDPPAQAGAEGKKALAKETAPPPRKVDVAPRNAEAPGVRKVDMPARRKAEKNRESDAPAMAPVQEPAAAEQDEPRR
jgi:hypothetical protein